MTSLSRDFQRRLLLELAEIYPHRSDHRFHSESDLSGLANASYLIEHGLINATVSRYGDGHIDARLPMITAKGLDFLADDGGLSAILGVVTVRIDSSSIRELVEARIFQDVPDETLRQSLISALRKAPADAMSSVIQQLATAGLSSVPSLLPLLQKALHL